MHGRASAVMCSASSPGAKGEAPHELPRAAVQPARRSRTVLVSLTAESRQAGQGGASTGSRGTPEPDRRIAVLGGLPRGGRILGGRHLAPSVQGGKTHPGAYPQ